MVDMRIPAFAALRPMRALLDGVEVRNVVAADENHGFVVRVKDVIVGDDCYETLYGAVRIEEIG